MTQVLVVNGNTYSDDGSVGKGLSKGRFRENLVPMFGDTILDVAGKVEAAANQVTLAEAAAATAAAAAATVVTGPGSNGTSTTTMTVGLGVLNLAIQPGKTLPPGAPVGIAITAAPRNGMYGTVDSYNPTTGALQAFIRSVQLETPGVFPTAAAWTVFLCGTAAFTGVLNEMKSASIAAAATIDLDAVTGNYLHITGSAGPITTINLPQGAERTCTVDASPTLANSANLILPTAANIICAAGDTFVVRGEGGGVARIVDYTRASGKALRASGFSNMVVLASTQTWTPPSPDIVVAEITVIDGGYGGGTTTNSTLNPSPGTNAGISVVPVAFGVTYTATVGAGGPGNAAGTALAGQAGGASSFSGAGLTTVTTVNAQLKRPGGPGFAAAVAGLGCSGDSLLSPITIYGTTPTGIGASAAPGAQNAASQAGRPGGIIIRF